MSPVWYLLLWCPRRVEARLSALERDGVIDQAPSLWQVWMGVLYMWTRVVRRPETIGVSSDEPVRDTPGARWLSWRVPRLVAVLRARVVNPLDQVGLGSSDRHVVRHLLGAYHPGDNALYDLYLLQPRSLEGLRERLRTLVAGLDPHGEHLRDLCVYEGYHERLLEMVERWLAEGPPRSPSTHPDTTLPAFLAWCARQPDGPVATARAVAAGRMSWMPDGERA
jgi:hypothetical protein